VIANMFEREVNAGYPLLTSERAHKRGGGCRALGQPA